MPPHAMDRVEHTLSMVTDSVASSPDLPKVKCVLVGDGAVGKTSLVVSYTTNGYPTEYVPTAFDNYSVVVTVDNQPIRLQLCDTAGQDDFDKLRPLCYPKTDVFLVCFSVVSPTSFHNIDDKWLPEIRKHCPKAPIILVGTQCDLRNDVKVLIELSHYGECPVTENEAQSKVQQSGMHAYVECSALTQQNLKEVFDTVILATLDKSDLMKTYRSSGRKSGKKEKVRDHARTKKSEKDSPRKNHDSSCSNTEKTNKGWKKLCCFL